MKTQKQSKKFKCKKSSLQKIISWYNGFLIVIPIIIFYPILNNGFAYMAADDNWMLYNNPSVYDLTINSIKYYFTSFYHGQYSPMNTLAYSLVNLAFGMDPFWYHVFSLVLHICNSLLVYILLLSICTFRGPAEELQQNSSKVNRIAFFTALLFAIHPVQVESVAWISASKVVFYATFFLLSLVLYLKYVKSNRKWYYVVSLVLFIISFGIKEQTVILPICLLLIDWYIKRDWRRGQLLLEKIPFFILAIGLGIVEIIGQQSFFGDNLEHHYYPFFQRLLLACYAIPEYLFKLVLPMHLSFWYNFPMKPGEPLPAIFWFYPLVVIALLFLLYRCWKFKKRFVLFGMGFFFANVVLALHLIPMSRGVMMADRYMYLSCIGIFFILSIVASKFFHNIGKVKPSFYLYAAAAVLYFIYLCSYTYFYADQWS